MEMGRCPVCRGLGRMTSPPHLKNANGWYGYDPETNTVPCKNCGGQYMMGTPSGRVPLNKAGEPCTHEYESNSPFGRNRGITDYICKHCGDKYTWDSTD